MRSQEEYFGVQADEKTSDDAREMQLVSFLLGEEEFGADILMVQEIIRMQPITRVPNAPHFVEGVINLRGKVIPIVDLRKRLHIDGVADRKKIRVIVVDVEGKMTGFMVDAVSQVLRIPRNTIEAPPAIVVAGIDSEYLTGVSKLGDKLLILLDFSKILTIREKQALHEVEA